MKRNLPKDLTNRELCLGIAGPMFVAAIVSSMDPIVFSLIDLFEKFKMH